LEIVDWLPDFTNDSHHVKIAKIYKAKQSIEKILANKTEY